MQKGSNCRSFLNVLPELTLIVVLIFIDFDIDVKNNTFFSFLGLLNKRSFHSLSQRDDEEKSLKHNIIYFYQIPLD